MSTSLVVLYHISHIHVSVLCVYCSGRCRVSTALTLAQWSGSWTVAMWLSWLMPSRVQSCLLVSRGSVLQMHLHWPDTSFYKPSPLCMSTMTQSSHGQFSDVIMLPFWQAPLHVVSTTATLISGFWHCIWQMIVNSVNSVKLVLIIRFVCSVILDFVMFGNSATWYFSQLTFYS